MKNNKDNAASVRVVNFGCRLNRLESQNMEHLARQAGLEQTILINGCAVTNEAERQVKQAIRKFSKTYPQHKIVVSGCGVQLDPSSYQAMPEVHATLGNSEKRQASSYKKLQQQDEVHLVASLDNIKQGALHLIDGVAETCRAFIEIQNGCNHRCTFCTIHMARGKSYSCKEDVILKQIEYQLSQGVSEVILTGVDITAYGEDTGTSLALLCKRILSTFPDLKRLRLSSLDCIEMEHKLLALFAEEERLMPHLHLSLQSGNNLILKRMLRRHSCEDAKKLITTLRKFRPDIVIGSDFITGFPSETDEMFQETLDLVADYQITHLHVFPFSSRNLAPASKMKNQVPAEIRKSRATKLRKLGEQCLQTWMNKRIKAKTSILVEQVFAGGVVTGKDPYFTTIEASPPTSYRPSPNVGDIIDVHIDAIVQDKHNMKLQGTFEGARG